MNVDYSKWSGVGDDEEQQEVIAFLEDVQNSHLDYVNHIESFSPFNPDNKGSTPRRRRDDEGKWADEQRFLDFRDELASVTARGEFLAREARASINDMRSRRGSTKLEEADASLRAALAAEIDADIAAECRAKDATIPDFF